MVTLSKTHNKMPRWLSEGISVYEEERADPAWGTALNPQFRAMILGRRADPAEPAQLGVPGSQDRAPPAIRLFRVGPGRRVPGRAVRPAGPEGRAGRPGRGSPDQREPAAADENVARTIRSTSLPQFARRAGRERWPRARPGRSPSCRPRPIRRPSAPGWRSIPRASGAGGGWRPGWWPRRSGDRPRRPSRQLKALYPGIRRAGERLHAAGRRLPATVRPGRRTQGPRGAGDARRRAPARPTCG